MDSLKIGSGQIRLLVNDDPSRIVSFNPQDVGFAERFYNVVGEFEKALQAFQEKSTRLGLDNNKKNGDGMPENFEVRLTLLKETCGYVRDRIDYVFGEGTSQAAFGDDLVLDQFAEFFEGITPFVEQVRIASIAKYMPKDSSPKSKPKKKKFRK